MAKYVVPVTGDTLGGGVASTNTKKKTTTNQNILTGPQYEVFTQPTQGMGPVATNTTTAPVATPQDQLSLLNNQLTAKQTVATPTGGTGGKKADTSTMGTGSSYTAQQAATIAAQINKGTSNPGDLSKLDELDAQLNKPEPPKQDYPSEEPTYDNTTTAGNGGTTGGGTTGSGTKLSQQTVPNPAPPTQEYPSAQPIYDTTTTTTSVNEGNLPYGQHTHNEYESLPDWNAALEQLINEGYDKEGELAKTEIDYATQKAVNDLKRQLEDAEPLYNAERSKAAAAALTAADNLALQNAASGTNGGIANKLYSDQQAAFDNQMLQLNLQQIQLTTDINRQVTDLEAQGDYEGAKALLEVGIARLQALQEQQQDYMNRRMTLAQAADNYDMETEQTAYNRAWNRLQAGLFNEADAIALGVDAAQARAYSDYVNTLRQLDVDQAKLAIEQQVLKNSAYQTELANAGTNGGGEPTLTNYPLVLDQLSTEDIPLYYDNVNGNGIVLYEYVDGNGQYKQLGTLKKTGNNYTINGTVSEIPYGAWMNLNGNIYMYDNNPDAQGGRVGWLPEDLFYAKHTGYTKGNPDKTGGYKTPEITQKFGYVPDETATDANEMYDYIVTQKTGQSPSEATLLYTDEDGKLRWGNAINGLLDTNPELLYSNF